MADIFERAWGNYAAFLEYLINGGSQDDWFNDQKGLVQLYAFASLLPYTLTKDNYDNFLLMNAVNWVTPGKMPEENADQVEKHSKLEHITQLVPSYSYFLDRLDILISEAIDPRDEPAYQEHRGRIERSQRELSNYQRAVDGQWADYLINNPGIPPEELRARRVIWERDNGHTLELQRLKRFVSQDNSRLNAWLRTKIKPELHALLKARQFFDDPGYHISLPVAADHDDPGKVHYWRDFHMQLPEMNLDEFLQNDSLITHSFSTEEEHYRRVEEKWKVSVKGKWGIFRGGGSAEKRTLEELSTKSKFSSTISFLRFEEIDIYRDQWFQEVLFSTIGKQFPEFWGPGGLLAVYPKSLIVARGMKVKVAISDEYKRTLEKYFSTGGSVRFGPFFSGGGSYSKDEKYMDFKLTQDGFELADGAKTIRLIGARVVRPNWSQAAADDYYEPLTTDELEKAGREIEKMRQDKQRAEDDAVSQA